MSTTPNITENEIKKVAELARLRCDATQIHAYAQNLSHILGLIAEINEINTEGVAPMASPLVDAKLNWRPDAVAGTIDREALQKLAKNVESGLYLVPQVIE
ncbi:MAG: Asp-tRNA(Asn)/Glu-tRNA(Gln) amidotransferase subunit GatC [Gammaproteobacteria bacterium]